MSQRIEADPTCRPERYVSRRPAPGVVEAVRVTAQNLAAVAEWCEGIVHVATITVPLQNAHEVPATRRGRGGQVARPGNVIARMGTGHVVFSAAEWDNAMVLESVYHARQTAIASNRRNPT